jgi:hypothetical protein
VITFLVVALLFPLSAACVKGSARHLKAIKTTKFFTVKESMEMTQGQQ